MRPSPYRWIPIILLALLLLVWISADLLPRFVGGLLGRGDQDMGAWSHAGDQLPEIIWDPSDPRKEEVHPPREDESVPEAESDPPLPEAETDLPQEVDTPSPSETSESRPDRSGAPAASGDPSSASPGEGPGEGRRRAARLLFQEWPRESLLADLEKGGSFRFRLRVEADGRVSDWEVLESFDCEPCASEAERIVAGLRFRPALEDGRPAACWVPFEIRFFASGENQP